MKNLGHWAICEALFAWIRKNIPEGSSILEFGSGTGTIELAKYYKVYSIEQDAKWCGLAKESNYIYAPIKNGWYDADIVFEHLPEKYDLILVDGPKGEGNRFGINDHWGKLNTNIPIVMDDVDREEEFTAAVTAAFAFRKDIEIINGYGKRFCVLKPRRVDKKCSSHYEERL